MSLVSLFVLAAAGGLIAHVRTSPIPDQAIGFVGVAPTLGEFAERTVEYEASGPQGAPVTVSYLDENAHARDVVTTLPWQQSVRTATPAVMTSLVVQSKTVGIGCRISIDGKLRDEQFSNTLAGLVNCKVRVG
ncbi:MAG: MmpS family transport accessory protein [Segniliparus sp.]|uniref:MmpS family transport accessory protein n=1 Tax=Segniliparus sp. TaxID=2804064 RepID=UPI003F3D1075